MQNTEFDPEIADTLESSKEPNSSEAVLRALDESERAFQGYMRFCQTIDRTYSLTSTTSHADDFGDPEFALFWASMEILKPAIYAKPPKPVAAPRFKDGGKLEKTVAELIERCLESVFDRGDIDQVMLGVRDDLALTNRGVAWVTYETDAKGGGQRICIEHLDRADFRHELALSWSHVGWAARRGWMTKLAMEKRFPGVDVEGANFETRREDRDRGSTDSSAKAGVWEVWSKTDNKVYWVTEGVPVILDEAEPHLNLRSFFPCPRPAYGTLNRRSLVPVPDYRRYARHLDQVNVLTARIYTLLNQVKLKVLIPAGGDIATAVETALTSEDDRIVIPVPAAAFNAAAAGGNLMLTVPLTEVATTIQGLIEARGQLIEDFYQLSGISDIMRGATEAQETLGAQQLKTQYGSVRVRDKIDELARIARDIAAICAEIVSANFSKETLLDLSRMTIPTKAEISTKTKEVEKSARDALKALADEAENIAQQPPQPGPDGQPQQVDPAAAEKEFTERQQAIIGQFQPILRQLADTVVLEDVMEMLRDEKVRNLTIDIETDSTVLTDEMAEKQSRSEFLNAFSSASAAVMALMQAGEPGAKLAGGIIKFALQPYRANRELDALVDEFTDNAAQMGAQAGQGEGAEQALVAAQNKLAEAEMAKAQAQTMKVQADAQGKMQDLQLRAAEAQAKALSDQQKMALELETSKAQVAETEARIQKIFAEIQAMGVRAQVDGAKVQNDQRKTDLDEFRAVADVQARQTDQAMSAEDRQRQAMESERSHEMGERQQTFTESQADRQQTFAERQAEQAEMQRGDVD